MNRVRRAARLHRGAIIANAAGLLVIAVFVFHLHRIPIGARTPERRPGWPRSTQSVAAVIVSRERLSKEAGAPPPFSDRDWSLSWMNTIHQEVGPCAVLDADSLVEGAPARYGLLVITAGAAPRLSPRAIDALGAWLDAGGLLVAELPAAALAPLTGVTPKPGASGAARHHRDLAADARFLAARPGLDRLPLYTRREDAGALAEDVLVLARLEGEPAVLARTRGAGTAVTLLFDFGLFLTATQQGRPEEDYSLRSRYPEILKPRLESNDLMSAAEYHDNAVPIADVLERALVQYLRARALLPALWYWPGGAPGVYLMTHDDEAAGARAAWMPEDEAARGIPSTCYYIATPGLGRSVIAPVASGGHTIGLHWNREMREVAGLPVLGPFLREVSLARQAARLEGALPAGARLRHNRLHYLQWDDRYAKTFAELAAAGIEMDASYGPDYHCKGYLFGTAFPFHPLDCSGMPYPLLELPYEHSEMEAGADSAYMAALALASRRGDHAAIVSLFHPPFWAWEPSVATYRFWRALPAQMAAAGHPAVSMDRVLDFERAREATALSMTRVSKGTWRIDYQVPPEETGIVLTLPERLSRRRVVPDAPVTAILESQGGTRWLAIPIRGEGGLEVRLAGDAD